MGFDWKVVEKNDLIKDNWSIISHSVWLEKVIKIYVTLCLHCPPLVFDGLKASQILCWNHIQWLWDHLTIMSYYAIKVSVVTYRWDTLVNAQQQPGSQPRGSLRAWGQPTMLKTWLHYTSRASHVKYHCTKLGSTVVMSIWNTDARQRQNNLSWLKSCYFISGSNKWSDLFVSIMVFLQVSATIIFTVKFEKITSLSQIKTILKVNSINTCAKSYRRIMQ